MKILTLLFSLLIPIYIYSQIINIPDDYPTIQQGIDAASNGDTVLVDTGTYIENLNYNGKNITVASLYLTTLDTSYISQTIIDGDSAGSVVRFANDESSAALLSGFTLTNGYSSNGGGIYCYRSSPVIQHVIVKNNNSSYNGGGGIYCSESNLTIQNSVLTDNTAKYGGGIGFWESNIMLQNVEITGNHSDGSGGGMYCYESNATLENVTVTYNSTNGYGGGIYNHYYSSLTFDEENRCNIYLNNAPKGYDVYSRIEINLILNMFTVIEPTEYIVYPLSNFSFDILQGKVEQVSADLFVSPLGDNNNSGLTDAEPLKNIFCAFAKSIPDSINPHTIHLAEGVYSNTSNEEFFPINLPDYLNLSGALQSGVIIDAEGKTVVIKIQDNNSNQVSGLTITGGSGSYEGGLLCDGSNLELFDITITGNSASSYGGGMYCSNGSEPILTNVIISNNSGGGLRCIDSNPMLENVIISNNSGGGLLCGNSNPTMKGVTIKNNWSPPNNRGGGLYLINSIPIFDTIHRCNIFLNGAIEGNDLYSNTYLNIVVDTFTVIDPTGLDATPLSNFSFDILHGKIERVEADLFVSPEGDNENSGLTAGEPLKTIHCALTKMIADSIHQHTIHLLEGTYSPSGSGQFFPVQLRDYISLSGESKEGVILDAENESDVILIDGTAQNHITNVTITGGSKITGGGQGISCSNSSPSLQNLIISDNRYGIYCNNSSPLIKDVTISRNMSRGIYCKNSSPLIKNVTISENGGGISCEYNSQPTIEDVIITDHSGHGIYCYNSDPIMKNVIISGNGGSGLFCENESDPYLENVTIKRNNGTYRDYEIDNAGGGIYVGYDCNPVFDTIKRCNIYLNSAIVGNDIYSRSQVEVIVDTFSVLYPTEFHAAPLTNITFNILNGKLEQVDSDLYVSETGDDANSGLTEDDPLKTIHHAFSFMLVDTNHHNTVQLLPGKYSPSATGELFPINIPDYYSLSGSSEDEVIVDAEGARVVITIHDNNYNRISGMTITGSGYGKNGGVICSFSNTILENLIITGNTAYRIYDEGPGISGGGISCYHANPLISNTVIKNNTGLDGGGLYCIESSPILENVFITNNKAEKGGGIYCSDNSYPVLKNVTIIKNTAIFDGGGIYCNNDSVVFDIHERSTIYKNGAGVGNDIYTNSPLHVIVDTFSVLIPTHFHATMLDRITFDILYGKYVQQSADLYVSPDGSETNSGLTADDPLETIHHAFSSIITDSQNPRTVNVLNGLYSPSSNNEFFPIGIPDFLNLTGESPDSTILDAEEMGGVLQISNKLSNMISKLTISGGLTRDGGGVNILNASPVFQDVIIKENNAWYSVGGLYCVFGNPVIINSIISENSTLFYYSNPVFYNSVIDDYIGFRYSEPVLINATALSGLRLSYGSHATLINSIFSNKYGSSGILLGADGDQSKITISWSDIEGGKDGIDGNGSIEWLQGNIDEGPMFVGVGDFPYALQNESPCINSGIPDTTGLNLPELDIAGNPRVYGGRIEMGAYENQIIHVGINEFEVQNLKSEVWNYPNPFSNSTTIEYQLDHSSEVTLTIFNHLGKQVDVIEQNQSQGLNKLVWIPENLANGVYYFRLQAGEQVATGKMVLMR